MKERIPFRVHPFPHTNRPSVLLDIYNTHNNDEDDDILSYTKNVPLDAYVQSLKELFGHTNECGGGGGDNADHMFRESIFTQQNRSHTGIMRFSRNLCIMDKNNQPCNVFLLTPMMEVDRIFVAPQKNDHTNRAENDDDENDITDLAKYMAEEAGVNVNRSQQQHHGQQPYNGQQEGLNQKDHKCTILLSAPLYGRFPGLDPGIDRFCVFMLSLDLLAKKVIQENNSGCGGGGGVRTHSYNALEALATYHTHILKHDSFGTKYKQTLDEICRGYAETKQVRGCKLKLKMKDMRSCPIWKAQYPRSCDHTRALDPSQYDNSNMDEFMASTKRNGCHAMFLLNIGFLYEFRDCVADKINRGITTYISGLVYWPHPGNSNKPVVLKQNRQTFSSALQMSSSMWLWPKTSSQLLTNVHSTTTTTNRKVDEEEERQVVVRDSLGKKINTQNKRKRKLY